MATNKHIASNNQSADSRDMSESSVSIDPCLKNMNVGTAGLSEAPNYVDALSVRDPVHPDLSAFPTPPAVDRPAKHLCEICFKTFKQVCHLRRHKRSIHEKQVHLCSLCGLTFKRGNLLNAHLKRRHPVSPSPDLSSTPLGSISLIRPESSTSPVSPSTTHSPLAQDNPTDLSDPLCQSHLEDEYASIQHLPPRC